LSFDNGAPAIHRPQAALSEIAEGNGENGQSSADVTIFNASHFDLGTKDQTGDRRRRRDSDVLQNNTTLAQPDFRTLSFKHRKLQHNFPSDKILIKES